eukprot:GHVR01011019.1.p1 GENE.GHVR01011019.1~~GHVR01011019.1.p1  ORF type:complete len:124 (-),score=31.45 GHVR01011019.1:393-764(-)
MVYIGDVVSGDLDPVMATEDVAPGDPDPVIATENDGNGEDTSGLGVDVLVDDIELREDIRSSPVQEKRLVPAPRKSARVKRPPAWLRSDDWQLSQMSVQPIWRQEADYVLQLIQDRPELAKDP